MTDLKLLCNQVSALSRAAGERILQAPSAAVHEKWGHYNFVTETDVAVQEFLRGGLLSILPGSRFFAEEQENDALTPDYTWIVDPIDGTYNFMRGRRASCVSIALMRDRQPVLGVVCQPYTGELFSAVKGGGALLNGQPIHVSGNPFAQALTDLGTSPYYAELAEGTAYCFHQFLTLGGDVRRVGSAALDLCDIAAGRADIFCELRLSPWDFAAGALLVQEAGGNFLMPYAESMDFGKPACILACNPQCLSQALKIVLNAKELMH